MMKPLVIVAVGIVMSSSAYAQYYSAYNPASMYGQTGAPVAGAYQGQNALAYGSGQGLLNQCGYPQVAAVDPTEKNELVVAARKDLKEAVKTLTSALKDFRTAQIEYDKKKRDLQKSLDRGVMDADAFIKISEACDKLASDDLKSLNVDYAKSQSTEDLAAQNEIYKKLKGNSGLKNDDGRGACYLGLRNRAANEDFSPKQLCTDTKGEFKFSKGTLKSRANTKDQAACEGAASDAFTAYKDMKDKKDAVTAARTTIADAEKDIENARDEAKSIQDELDEANAEAGIPAGIAGCPTCTAMYLQQQNQGPSKTALGIGAGLIAGLSTLSMLETRANFHDIAKMGFISQPYVGNMINTGLSTGLNAGLPFLMGGQYGQSPGGMVAGGYACAPTVYGSQMGYPAGPYGAGPYGGAYFPGGYGSQGMLPGGLGGAGYPGLGGFGGMPGLGGGAGGYNPYMQQQMAQMQQQYLDNLRAEQVAMYSIGYGVNNLNNQYGFAQSLLGSNQGALGGGGFGGVGGGGIFGANPMLGSTFGGGFAQNQCQGSLFGPSLNICGGFQFGGGGSPTFANGAYGSPFSQFGGSQFGGSQFGGSQFGGGSPFGNSFNLGGGATFPR